MKIPIPMMTPKQARNALALIAEGEIGVREEGGPNRGPRIREYQGATWLEPDSWPWCAAFICWIVREWLKAEPIRLMLGLKSEGEAEYCRPTTPGAFDFANWAKKRGLKVYPESTDCCRGDIVIFDFSHIGIVTKDAEASSEFIETVEGNTNGKGSRDGDGVFAKTRRRELVKQFIRIL